MGFDDGTVRITNFNVDDPSDLSDYIEYPVHDNQTGRVKTLCMSEDNRMLYTCGDDGNIFSFAFMCDGGAVEKCAISTSKPPKSITLPASQNRTSFQHEPIKTIVNVEFTYRKKMLYELKKI